MKCVVFPPRPAVAWGGVVASRLVRPRSPARLVSGPVGPALAHYPAAPARLGVLNLARP